MIYAKQFASDPTNILPTGTPQNREMSDMADIFFTRSIAVDGKERVPDTLVMIMTIHHSMTLTLGLPLVMKYRQLRTLHLLTFNLQWAAALAISANEYCKTLDLKNQKQNFAL